MAVTYETIQTQTLTSDQTVVTFSSIPSTYTDLVLQMSIIPKNATDPGYVMMRLNNDIGNKYSTTAFKDDASNSLVAWSVQSDTSAYMNDNGASLYTSNGPIVQCMAIFFDYTQAATGKTILSRFSSQGYEMGFIVNNVDIFAAVNRIDIGIRFNTTTANRYTSGSTFTLFGIKAA